MKKFIYLLVIGLTMSSCSRSDDPGDLEPFPGEWRLLRITSDGSYDPTLMDLSDKNVIYNFTSNKRYDAPESGNELIITGAETIGYSNGKYEYHFRKAYLYPGPWGENDQTEPAVSINGAIYSYTLTDGIMILGRSHQKGGNDYHFERVKN
ncbi:hypothetical protein [Salinimicrobium sediminilitoris]|uniref:hypothetical protein n=1 Tax=Salinimicrobium sediminilitoris TaxID=2876715 RepID=UPI001E623849|nr:hypothetical protein [Salinimicrobium sediminilitoris]MCC8360175.1 hypothetical protein [Salinimicrobium sediminilitoris]